MADAVPPNHNRPLSPFLFPPTGTYRWQLTSTMSILHRLTGLALTLGAGMLAWWLLALLGAPSDFEAVQHFLSSPIGRLLLLGWTWSLFFHLANGIRHLIWDTGHAMTLPAVYRGGWIVLAMSILLTAAAWYGACVLVQGG